MLEIDSLRKVYEDGTVGVDGLSLTVQSGEIVVLLGANGAGKTSTIMLILGFTEPTEGSVRIKGIDVQKDPLQAKRQRNRATGLTLHTVSSRLHAKVADSVRWYVR